MFFNCRLYSFNCSQGLEGNNLTLLTGQKEEVICKTFLAIILPRSHFNLRPHLCCASKVHKFDHCALSREFIPHKLSLSQTHFDPPKIAPKASHFLAKLVNVSQVFLFPIDNPWALSLLTIFRGEI